LGFEESQKENLRKMPNESKWSMIVSHSKKQQLEELKRVIKNKLK